MGVRTWLSERWRDAARWAGEGRSWPPRTLLLAVLAWFGWRHLADPEYDWHYLLSSVGMLRQDALLAGLVRLGAFLTLAGSVGFGGWLCVRLARGRKAAA